MIADAECNEISCSPASAENYSYAQLCHLRSLRVTHSVLEWVDASRPPGMQQGCGSTNDWNAASHGRREAGSANMVGQRLMSTEMFAHLSAPAPPSPTSFNFRLKPNIEPVLHSLLDDLHQ